MRYRKIIVFIAILTAAFIMIEPITVSAKTLSEIRQEIQINEKKLQEGKAQESSLASQVNDLEKKIIELEAAIDEGEQKLQQLEKELQEAQHRVDVQLDNLNSRLRHMYKTSSVGYLDVLLESDSLSQFLTNLELVKLVYGSDREHLKELKAARAEVEKKKEEIETLQAELEESKKVTEEQKAVVEVKKAEIAKSNSELNKMIDELQADADAMTDKINSSGSSSSNSSYSGGVLLWPTPSSSYITSKFGYRTDPYVGYHTGIDIGASTGSAIVAANDGKVILSGWNGGYGKCVVVDHGGGVTTLYAHCSEIISGKGAYVSRGQTIARVGSTGNSTGPHLHFEVRINGSYKNPLNYL